MGQGSKRFMANKSQYITDIKDIKVPNWVNQFSMFRSPSGAVEIEQVRKEYKNTLDKWLDQPENTNADLNKFRAEHGIIIDENGNELLTAEWRGERKRFNLEKKQTPQGGSKKLISYEEKQTPKQPWWNKVDEGRFVKLEGHHRVGLAHLGPFFEGASPKQAWELRQRILNETDLGSVGTDKRNWEWLTTKQHDLAHKLYGYATDKEVNDPKNKGLVFYDLEKQGKKGQPNFSSDFLNKLAQAPFDRPSAEFNIKNKYEGMRTVSPDITRNPTQNIDEANRYATKGDYLIEYLNFTDEAYRDSITQARKTEPLVVNPEATKDLPKSVPGLEETGTKKYQGARAFAKKAGQSNNPFVNTFGDTSALAIDGLNVILNPKSAGNWVDLTFSAGQAAGSWGGMALMAKGKVKAGQGLMKFSDQLGQAERSLNIGRSGIEITKADAIETFVNRDSISNGRKWAWRRGGL